MLIDVVVQCHAAMVVIVLIGRCLKAKGLAEDAQRCRTAAQRRMVVTLQ